MEDPDASTSIPAKSEKFSEECSRIFGEGRGTSGKLPADAIQIDTPGTKCVPAGALPRIDATRLVGQEATITDLATGSENTIRLDSRFPEWPSRL